MPNKKNILILIDDLGIGGAEVLLVGTLRELSNKYNIILVTLDDKCQFDENTIICHGRYNLKVAGSRDYLSAIFKLKKIIKKHQIVLVHAHLILSSFLARLACPKSIPFCFTVHRELSKGLSLKGRIIERLTTKYSHSMIAVSQVVLKDYKENFARLNKMIILHNYINDKFFISQKDSFTVNKEMKLVAVGNIRSEKNYKYLLNSLSFLKEFSLSLDIYGKTNDSCYDDLIEFSRINNLKVGFRGQNLNIDKVLNDYDLFVSCSSSEGFGISVLEAMAKGLPVLLSDITVYREITDSSALFFNIREPEALSNLLLNILNGNHDLNNLSEEGKLLARKYSKASYCKKLMEFYDSTIDILETDKTINAIK